MVKTVHAVLERDNLAATNDEYRNLLNEYREGILMYEISNRNVWDKAAKDKGQILPTLIPSEAHLP